MAEYTGKKAIIIGLASSGVAAAKLLVSKGAQVDVTDIKPRIQLSDRIGQLPGGTGLYLDGHLLAPDRLYDLAVISPGVPWDSAFPKVVRESGVELISELELASRHIFAPMIAITGANGKSTTTAMTGKILEAWGKKVFTGGNLGLPLCGAADQDFDWVVTEVSSFQLEGVERFHPKISMITNITPDHLDRHGDMETYSSLKARVFARQGAGDTLILNANDPLSSRLSPGPGVSVFKFGAPPAKGHGGAWLQDGAVFAALPGAEKVELFKPADLKVAGPHNLENAMAASLAGFAAGAPVEAVREGAASFAGLPHRMELVDTVDQVRFYNDSKATNVDAAVKSLSGFSKDVALIAGGSSKGADFAPLAEEVKKCAKGAVLIGQTAGQIKDALKGFSPVAEASSMDEAVEKAADMAGKGGAVLLAPACASFDMYKNFEQRGEAFRRAVERFKKKEV